MAHECQNCGQECYCDMDDTGGLPQPANCPHFRGKGCDAQADEYEDCEDYEEII